MIRKATQQEMLREQKAMDEAMKEAQQKSKLQTSKKSDMSVAKASTRRTELAL